MANETQLAKWGNSLAVRIPHALAKGARLEEGARVSLDLVADGSIVIRTQRRRYTIEELVSGINAKNVHGEVNWGPAQGKEIW